ncbi:MAG: hypothetical protein A4E65_02309 [Syntrophorhabdus sp. PtaU1.Bin153]|nr:MAG: hypothetical protein A4E65_02309 [Syntrophorhabdus sp. PtaU1.Bin153]
MTLKTDITADLDNVAFDTDEFAEAVTYNAVSINAIVQYGIDPTQDFDNGWQKSSAAEATIIVKVSDVASPQYQDTVVIGSTTYYVQRIVKGDAYTWTLELTTDERPRLR